MVIKKPTDIENE